MAGPLGAAAGEWERTARVDVRTTYSDNIGLAPPGDEESDLVFEVRPGISIHGEGARVKLDLDYSPALYAYTQAGDTEIAHRLQADSTLELVEQHLFVDLTAGANQANQRAGRYAADSLSRTDDLVQTFFWGLTPSYRHHFGSYADLLLRYGYDQFFYDSDDAGGRASATSDSVSHRVEGQLSSGRRFAGLGWEVSFESQKVDYRDEEVEDPTFERWNARVTRPFDRQLSVFAGVGYEDNSYAALGGDTSGPSWEVGGSWNPSERTSLELAGGDRYYGPFYDLAFSHRARRTVWKAAYNEEVTTTRDIQLEQRIVQLVDEFGEPIRDPLGRPIDVPIDVPVPSTEVLLRKRLDGSVSLLGRRTTTTLGLYHDRREYQETAENETVIGSRVTIRRDLSRQTTGALEGVWQTESLQEGGDSVYWELGLRLTRHLAEDVLGVLEYRYVNNSGDREEDDYRESRLTAGVAVTF
jgi:uncharacterized protein (PEP-CTERM system associated)